MCLRHIAASWRQKTGGHERKYRTARGIGTTAAHKILEGNVIHQKEVSSSGNTPLKKNRKKHRHLKTRKIEYQNYITQDKGIPLFCSVFFRTCVSWSGRTAEHKWREGDINSRKLVTPNMRQQFCESVEVGKKTLCRRLTNATAHGLYIIGRQTWLANVRSDGRCRPRDGNEERQPVSAPWKRYYCWFRPTRVLCVL